MPEISITPAQTSVNTLPADRLAALNALIQTNIDMGIFPAVAICAVKQGETLLNAAWGWLDPDTQALPTQPDSLFDLASVTKLFTTTAFLSLASEQGLSIKTPVVDLLPEFGASGPRPIDGGQDPHTKARLPVPEACIGQTVDPSRVTFWHLLTHSSGLAAWRDVYQTGGPPPLPPIESDPLSPAQRWANGLKALWGYAFTGHPGEQVVYSDLGLMLLGEAVIRLNGDGDLASAIQSRVLNPLDLATVGYNPLQHGIPRERVVPTEHDPTWRGRRCWGEVHDENACGVGGIAGHAGLFSTARDVAAFGQAWLTDSPRLNITPALLTAARQEHTFSEDAGRRGLGWMLKSAENSSAGRYFSMDSYGHTGFTGTSLWIDPHTETVIAVLTNRVYPGRDVIGAHAFRVAAHEIITAPE